jgi:transposase InsO family protein
METKLPLNALKMALARRRPPCGLIHHTDRGSQYASKDYRRALQDAGILRSMSRKSHCWDNAPGESVFSRIKDDLVYRTTFESKAQAKASIKEYIERFYNA